MNRFGHRGSFTNEGLLVAADKTAPGLTLLFPGRILANRYKILGVINAGAFKAHDLVLDQSVNVAEVTSACPRDRSFWYQKIRRLARFRNVYCLNILDVVCETSSDYVITERPRGKTIAKLLHERSPFSAEDVPYLIRHLAGAIDQLAVTGPWSSVVPSPLVYAESQYSHATCSEEESCPDQSRFSLKLDVWEFVRPRTNNSQQRLFSMVHKLGLRRPAVRQLALLTYELLGGGDIGDLDAARGFTPVRQLGKTGNAILRRGLEGSPCFKNAAELSRKLESAIRSDANKRRTRQTRTRRNSIALHRILFYGTLDWLSSLRLRHVVCLALFSAALIPESDSDPGNKPMEKSNANYGLVLNANVAPPVRIAPPTDLRIRPVSPLAVALATPSGIAPVLPINLEYSNPAVIIRPETKANAEKPSGSEQVPKHPRNIESATKARIDHEKYRSSGWSTFVYVQKRLIGLWHESLRQSEGEERGSHQHHWRAND